MELAIVGWRPGLKTVSLIRLLREYQGIGLQQAKQEVDGLLSGESIHLSGLDSDAATRAREELEALGCICE